MFIDGILSPQIISQFPDVSATPRTNKIIRVKSVCNILILLPRRRIIQLITKSLDRSPSIY